MDRETAQKDLATATGIREKEHATFVAESGDQKDNLDALNGPGAQRHEGVS